jgi:predicted transcriptional regulator
MDKPTPDQDHPSIFDALDEAAEARADAEAEADIAAGRVVSHDRVRAWLIKLAAGRYEPPPEADGCGAVVRLCY